MMSSGIFAALIVSQVSKVCGARALGNVNKLYVTPNINRVGAPTLSQVRL